MCVRLFGRFSSGLLSCAAEAEFTERSFLFCLEGLDALFEVGTGGRGLFGRSFGTLSEFRSTGLRSQQFFSFPSILAFVLLANSLRRLGSFECFLSDLSGGGEAWSMFR